jgi:hypothetical protein
MQTKLRAALPEASLTRILVCFEQELLAASEEEIMQAATDLGMDPAMKGSAAFFGVTRPFGISRADIHGLNAWARDLMEAKKPVGVIGTPSKAEPAKPKRLSRRRDREDPEVK